MHVRLVGNDGLTRDRDPPSSTTFSESPMESIGCPWRGRGCPKRPKAGGWGDGGAKGGKKSESYPGAMRKEPP
jgi:hypothetical protein